MVKPNDDIQTLNEYRQDFQDAVRRLEEIQEWASATGGTASNHADWTGVQEDLNAAIRNIYVHIDDVTSRSGSLEAEDGTELASLTTADVSRSTSTNIPTKP